MQAIHKTTARPDLPSLADAPEAAAIDIQNFAHTLTALSSSQGDRREHQAALCLTARGADRIGEDLGAATA